jgi:DNA polymerase elongation subunit (family B)
MEQIKVFTIDIETATESGFPDIKSANEEILLITIKDLQSKRVITFGSRAFVHGRDDVIYIHCKDELHLLKEFMIWWQQNYPDVLTGWIIIFFDVPYLIKRVSRELG